MIPYGLRSQFDQIKDSIKEARSHGASEMVVPTSTMEGLCKEFDGTRAELLAMRELLSIARIKKHVGK